MKGGMTHPMNLPAGSSVAEREAFLALQARLPGLFRDVFSERSAPRTVVVCPGLSLDPEVLAKVAGVRHYEERMLSMLMLLRLPGYAGKIGYFMSADAVKFRKPVVPGDTLFIEVEMTQRKKAIMKARGRCLVNGEVVSEAEMMFGVVDS